MSMTDQQRHDLLLEDRPDGAQHDSAACMFCTIKASEEGTVAEDSAIFTQEQHEQLVASAVEKATASVQTDVDAEVLSLNERLEASEKTVAELTEKVEEFERVNAQRDQDEKLTALADERVDKVKAVASFSDEQIDTRKTAWAKMSEEDFDAYLEDIRVVAKTATSEETPPKTAFNSTRETAGADDEGSESSVMAFFDSNLDLAAQS